MITPMQKTAKSILITGSSSGFGRLTVGRLLERGHTVVAAMRGGEARARELLAEEWRAYPGRLHSVDLHMEKPATFPAARALVDGTLGGRLDVLVNNAGYGLFGALEDLTSDELRAQFEVNFFGVAELTRVLLPTLRAARGRVINVSSIAGLVTFPGYGPYSASKRALEGLTEGLHYELAPFGVQVALIEPGGFRTGFSRDSKRVAAATTGSIYERQTRSLMGLFDRFATRLPAPTPVARRIVRLIEHRRMPLRNLVGTDAWAMHLLARALPDRLRVWLSRLVFPLLLR